jgi:hypothetical protein
VFGFVVAQLFRAREIRAANAAAVAARGKLFLSYLAKSFYVLSVCWFANHNPILTVKFEITTH